MAILRFHVEPIEFGKGVEGIGGLKVTQQAQWFT